MITRKTIKQFVLILAAAYVAIFCYVRYIPYSLAWNITASIPKGLYFSTDARRQILERGQIACFDYQPPEWAAPRHYFPTDFQLCKPIVGMSGDVVSLEGSTVLVQAEGAVAQRVGVLGTADSAGRPLPQDVVKQGAIPFGYYMLVAGAHPNSLDSRYLGLVEGSRITRTLIPLITW